MTFSALQKISCLIIIALTIGCSGESTSEYKNTTTFNSKNQVVAGLVYGYGHRTIYSVTAISGQNTLSPANMAPASGQFAITGYPSGYSAEGDLFYADFTDGTRLYSVWNGTPTPTADVTETYNQLNAPKPVHVTVSPDNFDARANINPITDLAYWYWQYDNKKHPYSDYLTSVFLFFRNYYSIPEQNAVHDYPSLKLSRLFNEIQIELLNNPPGFVLIDKSTDKEICTATFINFPICN